MRKSLFVICIALMLVAFVVPGVVFAFAPSTSRVLPATVAAGASFNVGITVSGYGSFGQVVESLPAGFSYAGSSIGASQVQVTGNVVKFTLIGETSFTYSVTASATAGSYTFSGIIKDEDLVSHVIGGNTGINISGPVGPAAVPTLNEWGLIILFVTVAGFAAITIKKRYAVRFYG